MALLRAGRAMLGAGERLVGLSWPSWGGCAAARRAAGGFSTDTSSSDSSSDDSDAEMGTDDFIEDAGEDNLDRRDWRKWVETQLSRPPSAQPALAHDPAQPPAEPGNDGAAREAPWPVPELPSPSPHGGGPAMFSYLGVPEEQLLGVVAQREDARGSGRSIKTVLPQRALEAGLHPGRKFRPVPQDRYVPAELLPSKLDERRVAKARAMSRKPKPHAYAPVDDLTAELGCSVYNTALLSKFLSQGAQIAPQRLTRLNVWRHKKVAREIRKARTLALLPYEGRIPDPSLPRKR
ncbi:unnamed protein product [Pedinophyceae sp. YPF-701]|nr:unnamed protein product [Pedinophyceae sp. YPF-701]